jgi:N-acetylmuramoyl-L-alanine amidase
MPRLAVLLVICSAIGLLLTSATPASPDSATSPQVQRLSLAERSDGRGLVLRIHVSGQVAAFSEPRQVNPGVYEVTLFNTAVARSVRQDRVRGSVRSYSITNRGGHSVVQIELAPGQLMDVTAYRDRDSPDLLVAMTNRASAPVAGAPAPVRGTPAPATPRSPESLAEESARWRMDTIVIDAGHGGRDPGAVANGIREKDVTLGVALRLGRLIEQNLGVRVVYTRQDDRFIELHHRGRMANEAGGKLFVSIHANSAPNRSATGTETFFLGASRSEAAQRVMERENSVVRLESDPDRYRDFDDQALIRRVLTHSAYMRKSEQLAALVEGQFGRNLGRRSRGVKQANFYVLWGASMPAILVELGFITNPEEATYLASDRGQNDLALGIFRAIADFKEQYERGLDLSSVER